MSLATALFVGLLLHMVGDYITQSTWMAEQKTQRDWPAWAHAITYSIPFAALLAIPHRSWLVTTVALGSIIYTHFVIDRYRLAKHLVWLKNQIAPKTYRYRWDEKAPHGYAKSVPDWLGFWLMVLADNTVHVIINSVMIAWVYEGGR